MPKWCLINRVLQLNISTCLFYILWLIAFIHIFSLCGEYNYTAVPLEAIDTELYKEISPDIVYKKSNKDCDYNEVLSNKKTLNSWDVPKKFDDFSARGLANGTYVPEHCNPVFSVAILVTYRNRQSQLDVFLPFIHNFLRKQNIHYRLYLIEQQDNKPWNKGALYNIGAKIAMADKFPCLILHDVDMIPLDEANLYVCLKSPRHMSASLDKFRYVLTYDILVGGVLAIRSDQFKSVNGFSNSFISWGGEDDEFSTRLQSHGLNVLRFPQPMSRYTMLLHMQEPKNADRYRLLNEHKNSFKEDGFNSVPYETMSIKYNKLFTLIGVKL